MKLFKAGLCLIILWPSIYTTERLVDLEPKESSGKQRPEGPPPKRKHTAYKKAKVILNKADQKLPPINTKITIEGDTRIIRGYGIPKHYVGRFPNQGNPHRIRKQNHVFKVTVKPKITQRITLSQHAYWGVAINGTPFEAGAAEYWRGDRRSGWNYDAMGGAISLGLDANHAHVQPSGAYHYHAAPIGLMNRLNWRKDHHSPLIGWAADGFPVYVLIGDLGQGPQKLRSSYQLKKGRRPGGRQPKGVYDGAFVEDYEFIDGSGDLDQCNGVVTYSPDHPKGMYAYFITERFPFIARCWRGAPDPSFRKKRR